MDKHDCEVLVLGGGPGGYVAAIRAGQLGLNTILVEKDALGGICLNVGCIPSKALIHMADTFSHMQKAAEGAVPGVSVAPPSVDLPGVMTWKDGIVERLTGGVGGLLKKSGVTVLSGTGRMRDGKTCIVETVDGQITIGARHIVLAPGSETIELEALPFGGPVISSTQALALDTLPTKLVVVGGGYIGLELGTAFAKFGVDVTIVEATGHLLPQYDRELSSLVGKRLKDLGVDVLLDTKAVAMSDKGDVLEVAGPDGVAQNLEADKVLVTVGRRARLKGWGLSELGLAMNGSAIRIDAQCRTSMTDVFAIGDVTGEPMLAHRAMAQGNVVAEIIAGKRRSFEPAAIPAVCFTDPEIVSVGFSADEAKANGYEVKVGKFPLLANGRAMTLDATQGFVRVVARKDNDLVLGMQAAGQNISEFSSAFALALEMGATLEDVAATIHAHPTQGEGIQEAAMLALGKGLHI
ncbi:MAG: dihydrolipoyl dehydrogenase [Alphaproteobacteria bacterium]|nr:dihydrolipoyl dehydrogenase [Alphaproteobacteria bacterium]